MILSIILAIFKDSFEFHFFIVFTKSEYKLRLNTCFVSGNLKVPSK